MLKEIPQTCLFHLTLRIYDNVLALSLDQETSLVDKFYSLIANSKLFYSFFPLTADFHSLACLGLMIFTQKRSIKILSLLCNQR